jgi:hypothetical protein
MGTGLKPLNVALDWLEQDGGDGNDAAAMQGRGNWVREMRVRHKLIAADCGCTVWVSYRYDID